MLLLEILAQDFQSRAISKANLERFSVTDLADVRIQDWSGRRTLPSKACIEYAQK